ncbi:MAG: protein kinase [Planctomycetaceae bacterium]|nr:protein kinase [Planctomycetaceae bacterium]MBT4724351.1 protein kinase [Planctomycetaceae bacterium]MBT5123821.1 protein kinase [Planctomycetaceae bacterium]MBT5597111.1 protein kinase [Planctomycetaceae bacterium]MBT7257117.1 protein kinase [Planctomycetaceae bacterium]
MPDHEDSPGSETLDGSEAEADLSGLSLSDSDTMSDDTAANSLGEEYTLGDANIDDDLFDDGMKLEDLSARYTEKGVLGKGGFGEVKLAMDTRLNRKVAIKRIQGKAARSKTAVQRFLTEAQSIATLSHNNIVQIYDYGRSTDGPFLIMECVQGGSLFDKCKAGPIELDEAVKIFSQVCDGLAKAHAANIIHRDIKPANVLMTEDGVPKLTDFGLAKDDTADTGVTMEGAVIGTRDFMPPEQQKGAEFTDHRSDLWSLAATFYQMLTGKSPKVINISAIPPKLQSVVAKALEESKEDRFQSVVEMREEILNAHAGKMDTSRSLGEGECPQCTTINPPNRKYCRNCGGQLQVSCLNCEMDMAIWDNSCGECGVHQIEQVERKSAQLDDCIASAWMFCDGDKFNEALDVLKKFVLAEHPRYAHLTEEKRKVARRIRSIRKEKKQQIQKEWDGIKRLSAKTNYEEIFVVLREIPKQLMTQTMRDRFHQVRDIIEQIARDEQHFAKHCRALKRQTKKGDVVQWKTTVVGLIVARDGLIAGGKIDVVEQFGVDQLLTNIEDLEQIYLYAELAQQRQQYTKALELLAGANDEYFKTDRGEQLLTDMKATLVEGETLKRDVAACIENERFVEAATKIRAYGDIFPSSEETFPGLAEFLSEREKLEKIFTECSLQHFTGDELTSYLQRIDEINYIKCGITETNRHRIDVRISQMKKKRSFVIQEYEDGRLWGLLEQTDDLGQFFPGDNYLVNIIAELNHETVPCFNCGEPVTCNEQHCGACCADQELMYKNICAITTDDYVPADLGEAIRVHQQLSNLETIAHPKIKELSNGFASQMKRIEDRWFSELIQNAKLALKSYHFDVVTEILPEALEFLPRVKKIVSAAKVAKKQLTEYVSRFHASKNRTDQRKILEDCLEQFPGYQLIEERLEDHLKKFPR